ncbi:T9SS type A sorting domain-containing protein [Pontibacter chitinilyticus]|uniref:T9SS type A sorting domain-containing protein n=1 Tax=Pontibacter chitinilyticus TaxID=2674989 RepID=UPI00321BA1D2
MKQIFALFFFACLLLLHAEVQAQTPGLIYKPAANGGNLVLDPNKDGYVSKTTAGFSGTNDEGAAYSEIPYRAFPAMINEPLSDLNTGASGGHTDLATSSYTGTSGSPIAAYFDGTNFLFRVRLGGQSTASKGYSILIDSDNDFTGISPNPGFEYEVLLATNFDVRVIKHTKTTTTSTTDNQTTLFSGSVDQYFQKSIAATKGGGDADYFYDFYVPLTAFKGGITSTTALRMSGITITSAQSGITGTVSDVGGVKDDAYGNNKISIWKDVIATFPSTSPTGIQSGSITAVKALAPVVNSPILSGSSTVTGSSVEAAGSTITVYQGTTSIGTTTVAANGTWSLTVGSAVLTVGQTITATVLPTGKSVSLASTGVVVATGLCNTEPPVITGSTSGSKGLTGTTTVTGTLNIYDTQTNTLKISTAVTAGVIWTYDFGKQGHSLPAGTYYATVLPADGGCESRSSNQICYQTGGNGTVTTPVSPTITSTTLLTTSTQLTGTATTASASIIINKNGVQVGTATAAATATTGTTSYAWSFIFATNGVTLAVNDVFYAYTTNTSNTCNTTIKSSRSNAATFMAQSTAPTITGSYCGTTSTVTGTSTEAAGTAIYLFVGGTQIASPTGPHAYVTAYGNWTATGLAIPANSVVTAKASAPNKMQSAASSSVSVSSQTSNSNLAITGTITEGATSLSGTAPANATVKIYVAGSYLTSTTATASGAWTASGISPYEIFAGATVYLTAISGTSCESAASAAVKVQCKAFNTAMTASLSAVRYCPNTSATVKLSTSEVGIVYNLYDGTGTTTSGTSVLGTGGAISLTSAILTVDPTSLIVKAIKVGAECTSQIGATQQARLYPSIPKNYALAASVTSGCPNLSTVITMQSALAGYTYQLYNSTSGVAVGTLLQPTADGNLSFPAVTVPVTTEYSVIIKRVGEPCEAQNVDPTTTTIKITITGPDVTKVVTAASASICVGTSTSISVATQSGYTYKVFLKGTTTQVGASIAGDGTVKSVSTGNLAAGTYTYTVQVSSGTTTTTCTTNLTQEATVQATNGVATTVSAGTDKTVCGTSTTLSGSDPAPGTGKWMVTGPNTPTITNVNSATTAVSGLVSGTYQFTWTVTSNCSSTTTVTAATVNITVNCPALYNVAGPKNYDAYRNDDVLATVSDADGGVIGAQKVSGSLPPGTTLNTTTGAITVSSASALTAGVYTFTIRTTDAKGKTTDSPLTIRINSPTDALVVPLPVELAYFNALRENGFVVLQWITASEKDNLKFVVERSLNGTDFKAIGEVAGSGNSNQVIKYKFEDKEILPQTVYYRLKQVDFDGTVTPSKVISVTAAQVTATALKAYPNPFHTNLSVIISAETSEAAQLLLLDLHGAVVLKQKLNLQKGVNECELPLSGVSSGMYILKMIGVKTQIAIKVVKAN